MPTYEYICTECGEGLEVVQKFTDDALTECPNCGGKLRKVFGNVGVTFKGSGFYKTDSRKGSTAKPKADTTDASSTSSTDSPASSDAKPAESKPAASESKPSTSTNDKAAS